MLGFAPAAKSAFAIGLGDKNENLELRAVMEKLGYAYGPRIKNMARIANAVQLTL